MSNNYENLFSDFFGSKCSKCNKTLLYVNTLKDHIKSKCLEAKKAESLKNYSNILHELIKEVYNSLKVVKHDIEQ